ncbi:hypothetical protein [Streptomyces sp. Z26]|uniref:hypothetical protein n=1 Tax=Streptomyces sp. Z26 TaxID=2500177 RepID=UPI000EF14B80|nr:hypothetical protein [Streptomyces sp. Z26]RLL67009.1 hypothetical protein D7M15_09175 [Streptomyces sp. Z26]
MTSTIDIGRDIITRYADDVAFVADEETTDDLATFAAQLAAAAENAAAVDLLYAEDLTAAAVYLADVPTAAAEQRPVLLARAEHLLRTGCDALEEYREMC